MKYQRRLKANIVDAVRYADDNKEEITNFCELVVEDGDKLFLPISDTRITIEPGDYLLRDLEDGSFHVCEGTEFIRCYEELEPLSLTTGSYREFMKMVSEIPILPRQTHIRVLLDKPQFDQLKYEVQEFSSIKIPESHPNIMKLTINQNKYIIFHE